MHAFLDLTKNHQKLVEKFHVTNNQLQESEKHARELKNELEAFNYDWEDLLQSYNRVEPLARLAKKYKSYFSTKLSEVYHARAQLREPTLRPKVPPGCLNCSATGHCHRTCSVPYNGKFCQTCACTDFSTRECPWPHFANATPSLPEHLKCKRCRSPRNLPDPHCSLCRRQLIATAVAAQKSTALEIEENNRRPLFTGSIVQPQGFYMPRHATPPTIEAKLSTEESDSSSDEKPESVSSLAHLLTAARNLDIEAPEAAKEGGNLHEPEQPKTKKEEDPPSTS